MNLKYIFLFFIFFFESHNSTHQNFPLALDNLYLPFNQSMQTHFSEKKYKKFLNQKPQKKYMPFLKELYEKNNFSTKSTQESKLRIPRIIHQIWLGSPLPDRYKKLQKTWQEFHSDWEYKLWTDEDIPSFNLVNQQAYDNATNYGEKSNIFRYEILYRYGGLYIDTDFECLQPFDILHHYYDFYTGIATANRLTLINNGLIGAIPGHPILEQCITAIKNKVQYKDLANIKDIQQFNRNGTFFFGYAIFDYCMKKDVDLSKIFIAPASYFYPWPGSEISKDVSKYLLPSSFAVHYWDSSWFKQKLPND